MRIAEFSVRRYQFTFVAFGLLVALGLYTLMTIPRAEDPSFPTSNFLVTAVFPGATPQDIEKLVVDPLEEKISELDDIKHLKTSIYDSVAISYVEFSSDTDGGKKHEELLRQVNLVRAELPRTLQSLEVKRSSMTDVAVLQLALVAEDAPFKVMEEKAEALKSALETLDGIKRVEIWGLPEQRVEVVLDPEKLFSMNLSPGAVAEILEANSAVIPGGGVDVGARRFNVETSGKYEDVEELAETPIRGGAGAVVRLRDVAEVREGYRDEVHRVRFQGKRAAFITVMQKDGQNVFAIRDAALGVVEGFQKGLPRGMTLHTGFDQSRNVERRLSALSRDFFIAIGLVLVTLLPLGLRASLIVMVSIPLSLALGLTLLSLFGFSINQLSIVGFVIALGLLVDDSIVVIENVIRFVREGRGPKEAAIAATKQIGTAVLGCTATLVFAFLPLLFLPGAAGKFIRSMPVAVVATIAASLLVSVAVIPFMASLFLKKSAPDGNRVYQLFHRTIEAVYRPMLRWSLSHPRMTLMMAAAAVIGSLSLVPIIGFSLFPKAGIPQFLVTVETAEGAALDETDRAVRFVEEVLSRHPEIDKVMSNVGKGNPMIYYNVGPSPEQRNRGEVFVSMSSFEHRESGRLLDGIRGELERYAGARIELKEFENGPPLDAPIAIRLLGTDLDVLRALAIDVEKMMTGIEGTTYVKNPVRTQKTSLALRIDRLRAGQLGVPEAEIERSVRLALEGLEAGQLRNRRGDENDIVLLLSGGWEKKDLSVLNGVYVRSLAGGILPLTQVASLEFSASPNIIQRYNEERTVVLTAHVKSGYNTDRVTKQLLERLDAMTFPNGTRYMPAGEIESREESFGGLGAAILIAAFGVLAVLVLEFKTFKSTLIVASVIPLGVVGGLTALFLSGYTLSFTAVIGFIALLGIEIKNSVLLVDFTNQLRMKGVSLDEAITQAGEVRFFPILLTALTSLGGLIPLAAERSSLYSPLAIVIIGGLLSSTILARLVTPVLYKLLAPEVEVTEAHDRVVSPDLVPEGTAA